MPDALMLAAALAAAVAGLGWFALAMETHWAQVFGERQPQPAAVRAVLRLAGTGGVAGALALCLRVDHASMAVLVWAMALAAAALLLAFTLAWRPRWLALLWPWPAGRQAGLRR